MRRFRPIQTRHGYAIALAVVLLLLGTTACADNSKDKTGSGDTSSVGSTAQAIAAAPTGTFPGTKAAGAPVKIGLINPEGGASVSQPESREAAEAVVRYANENLGGLGGRPISLVICKSKEDSAAAADCANQMVESGVAAVVVTSTAQGAVMAPIIQKAKIPYGSYNGASATELTAKDYSYAWTGGFPSHLAGMAKYAREQKMTNVTMYVLNVPAVTNGAKAMGAPAFKAAGVTLDIVPIPPGTPDASPQVSAGLKKNPQAVAMIGDGTFCTSVLKALTTLGSKAEKMVIQSCNDPAVFQATGDALEGAKVFSTGDGVSDDPQARIYRAVMAKYAPGTALSGPALSGYQSMLGLVRAAAGLTGDVTPASVNAAIRSAKDVPVPAGHEATMTCDGKAVPGLPMICNGSANVATIKDQKITGAALVK